MRSKTPTFKLKSEGESVSIAGTREHVSTPMTIQALEESRQVVKERMARLRANSIGYDRVSNLAHYLDLPMLLDATRRLRLSAAPGVDYVRPTWYLQHPIENSKTLIAEVKQETYQPRPARRVAIPKDDGSQRYLGLPSMRDKHLQCAVAGLMEAIYEPHFHTCSYGFRPGRSAQMALTALRTWVSARNGAWILEVDLAKFFDTIPHEELLATLAEKINDRTILSLVRAWLTAGVKVEDKVEPTLTGTPQGGVVSPILANVYLHKVLDTWAISTLLPECQGEGTLVRYADDFVLAFENEDDCSRARQATTARLEEFGLTVNPAKTKVIDFRCPENTPAVHPEGREINLLGFTLYWTPCPVSGWTVGTRTSEKSLKRFADRLSTWMLDQDVMEDDTLSKAALKLAGHLGYFGIPGNEDGVTRAKEISSSLLMPWGHLSVDDVCESPTDTHSNPQSRTL